MIPRLLSFYRAAPHPSNDWLQVPQWKLWMYVRMLPILEGQAELREYRVAIAAGGLQMDEHAHARYTRSLEKRASGETERRKPTKAELAEHGVAVIEE